MSKPVISFIGGGNMATSLIGGLIADGCEPGRLRISEPDAQRLNVLQERFGVQTTTDNADASASADVVVLAVKPQTLPAVAMEISSAVQSRQPLVISIAAGIRTDAINRWLGGDVALVRGMPNTPALVQSGATGLFATPTVSSAQRELAESILRAVGLTLWVDSEDLLDAVTAISGSGPAYFFLFMEAMQAAGTELGLSPADARLLTLQTAFGAARMALESEDPPAVLRARVTSPGGTTERALEVFESEHLRAIMQRALTAARDRSKELSQQSGKQ